MYELEGAEKVGNSKRIDHTWKALTVFRRAKPFLVSEESRFSWHFTAKEVLPFLDLTTRRTPCSYSYSVSSEGQ